MAKKHVEIHIHAVGPPSLFVIHSNGQSLDPNRRVETDPIHFERGLEDEDSNELFDEKTDTEASAQHGASGDKLEYRPFLKPKRQPGIERIMQLPNALGDAPNVLRAVAGFAMLGVGLVLSYNVVNHVLHHNIPLAGAEMFFDVLLAPMYRTALKLIGVGRD